MSEVYVNQFVRDLMAPYTAGASTIQVSQAAPAGVQNGTFRVRLSNPQATLLIVSGGQNTTTWQVSAEANDAGCAAGAQSVWAPEVTEGMLDAIRTQWPATVDAQGHDLVNGGIVSAAQANVSGAVNAGNLTVTNNSTFGGTVSAAGFGVSGANAGYVFSDRTDNALSWVWYSTGDVARLYNSVNGDRVAVTKAGNVGIGTVSPSTTLQVAGSLQVTGYLAPTAGAGVEIENVGGNCYVQGYDRGANRFIPLSVNGNPVAMTGGNVGIGTTGPGYPFTVSANGAVAWAAFLNTDWVAGSAGTGLLLIAGAASGAAYAQVCAANAGFGAWGPLRLDGAPIVLGASSGGYVGIGTTMPGNVVDPLTINVCASGQIRLAYSTAPSVVLRNDGGNFYFLLTNNGDPWGAFNGLRPLYIGLANGIVTMGQGAIVGAGYAGMQAGDLAVGRTGAPTTGAVYFGNSASQYLYFNGSGWQFSPGMMGIGKAPAYNLDVQGNINFTGSLYLNGVAYTGATNWFYGGGTSIGWAAAAQFAPSGGVSITGYLSGGVAYYTIGYTSDRRLKQHIKNLEGGLDPIRQLRPIHAEWNGLGGHRAGRPLAGVLAHQVAEWIPEAVEAHETRLRPADKEATNVLGIDPLALIAHLILAVQQLADRIETIESEIEER